nr:VP4 [Rotavirus A]
MASNLFKQLLSQSYVADLQDNIQLEIQGTEPEVIYPDKLDPGKLGTVEWGSGSEQIPVEYLNDIGGPYPPSSIETPSKDYWMYSYATKSDKLFFCGNYVCFAIRPNTSAYNHTFPFMGTQCTASLQNSDVNNWLFQWYYKVDSSTTLLKTQSDYKSQDPDYGFAYKKGTKELYVATGTEDRVDITILNKYTATGDYDKITFFDIYIIDQSNKLEVIEKILKNGVNWALNQIGSPQTRVKSRKRSIRSIRTDVEQDITMTTLWKETKFSQDIELQFRFGILDEKSGGLGYKWANISYKPENHSYTWKKGDEDVLAHTTVSVSGVHIFNYRGPTALLPTDFVIDRYDVLANGAVVNIDYWDDTPAFKNMIYVKQLAANLSTKSITGGSRALPIPTGTHPVFEGGTISLIPEGVTLSTQYTDDVTLNSLRFKFTVSIDETNEQNKYKLKNTIREGYGLPAYNSNPDNGTYYTLSGRFSFISLIPTSQEYNTPILNSTTVRKDLEQRLDALRNEFNELSASIALSQLIELATLPLDMFSMFSSLQSLFGSFSSLSTAIMKKFKTSKTGKYVVNASKNVPKLRRRNAIRDTALRLPDAWDGPINDVDDLIGTMRGLNINNSKGVTFDDISATVLQAKLEKIKIPEAQIPEIVTRAADDFIPKRAYRVISTSDDICFEVDEFSTVRAFKVATFEEIPVDTNKFYNLLSESPVISSILDLKTIKNLNDNYGISKDTARALLNSDPNALRLFIDSGNPIIRNRVEELLRQCLI